jgi:hypothetical protein
MKIPFDTSQLCCGVVHYQGSSLGFDFREYADGRWVLVREKVALIKVKLRFSASVEMFHRCDQSEPGFSWCSSRNHDQGLSRSLS